MYNDIETNSLENQRKKRVVDDVILLFIDELHLCAAKILM